MTTRSLIERAGTFVGLVLVAIIFGALIGPQFFAPTNLELMARQMAIVSIAAVGMTIVIVSGGIDLSVGSMIALMHGRDRAAAAHRCKPVVRGAGRNRHGGAAAAWSTACSLHSCAWCRSSSRWGRCWSFAARRRGLAEERRIEAPATWLNDLLRVTRGETLLPSGIWAVIALAVLVAALLRYTRFGRHVFAIGSNERMARLCGVAITRTKVIVYALSAAFVGFAGLLQFSKLSVGDPTVAVGLELDVIAAVIIGGGSLSGGRGTVAGTLIGAAIMTIIQVGCSQKGLANWVQQIVTGGIIVAAVALDRIRSTRGAAEDRALRTI